MQQQFIWAVPVVGMNLFSLSKIKLEVFPNDAATTTVAVTKTKFQLSIGEIGTLIG